MNRMKITGICLLPCIILILISACAPQNNDYFPLGNKLWWQYSIKRFIKGEEKTQKLIIANLQPVENATGEKIYPRKRLDERLELYQKEPEGIFQVDSAGNTGIRILPQPLEINSKWREQSRIYFLDMSGAFHATFKDRIKNKMDLDYIIESFDDSVTVPAGSFSNCMRVRASGSMFAGHALKTYIGIRFIQIEQTEWYAPGIGLIKRVRHEFTTPDVVSNKYVEELEEYKGE